MPTTTQLDNAPASSFLSAVRESQAAVIDVIRVWSDIGQQLTRNLGLPAAAVDVAGAVDRVFDVAEQTLAAQRQLALTLAGVVQGDQEPVEQPQAWLPKQDRRPDGRTYEERNAEELRERAAELQIEGRASMSKDELITALRDHRKSRSARTDPTKSQPPKQERTPDRRTYEERSVEELRERARELDIEGRSAMSKDELIAALREHQK